MNGGGLRAFGSVGGKPTGLLLGFGLLRMAPAYALWFAGTLVAMTFFAILWISVASADCVADRTAFLGDAQEHVLTVDIDRAQAALDAAEEAMACGSVVAPEVLARFWLIDGALQVMRGDAGGAAQAFQSAAWVAPDVWMEDLGPAMRSAYDEAASVERTFGTREWTPTGATGWIDGRLKENPTDVAVGLRLIQAGTSESDVTFARIVLVTADAMRLETSVELPRPVPRVAELPAPDPVAPVVQGPTDPWVRVYGGVGSSVSMGQEIDLVSDGQPLIEPGLKVDIPLEFGAELRRGMFWLRAGGALAPLVNGSYLFALPEGVGRSAFAYGGRVGLGLALSAADVGVVTGVSLPGRIPIRTVAGVDLGDLPLKLELRVGLNLVTQRPVEPAGGLSLMVIP